MWFKFHFAFWWLCFIEIKRPWQCVIHFRFLLRKCLIAYLCFTIILLSGRKPNRKSWGWYVFWWGVVEVLQQSYTHIAGTTFLNLYLNVKCIFDKHGGHRLWPAIYIMYYTVLNLSFLMSGNFEVEFSELVAFYCYVLSIMIINIVILPLLSCHYYRMYHKYCYSKSITNKQA